MLKRNISIGLAIAALGGLSACGGYDEPTAPAPAKAAASATKVAVQDNSFAPASLKVKVGETITFENSGARSRTP